MKHVDKIVFWRNLPVKEAPYISLSLLVLFGLAGGQRRQELLVDYFSITTASPEHSINLL